TSFHGCERCDVVGKTIMKRRVFKSLNARLRTDASFRGQRDKHHKKHHINDITSIDNVMCFPLDYMQLVCLGTFKRF
ncbi:hypothetical protein DAPPUDRAFT_17530, partial [Daphnia pulex]